MTEIFDKEIFPELIRLMFLFLFALLCFLDQAHQVL